jgi:hypothetical protein
MSIRKTNLIPWLAVFCCLGLAPAAKATDVAAPANASHSRAKATPPKLAEQDVWLRWKLAHNRHKAGAESRVMPAPASATQASVPNRDAGKPANPDQPVK